MRRRPGPNRLQRCQRFAGLRHAPRHVGATHRVDGQAAAVGRDHRRVVERPEKRADLCPERLAAPVERHERRLAARQQLRAEERPRERRRRTPDVHRCRDRARQLPRQSGQHSDLALDAGDRDRPARKPERDRLVDKPQGVVPALGEWPQLVEGQRRELLPHQAADERLVDRHLGDAIPVPSCRRPARSRIESSAHRSSLAGAASAHRHVAQRRAPTTPRVCLSTRLDKAVRGRNHPTLSSLLPKPCSAGPRRLGLEESSTG